MTAGAALVRGDALALPLADESVDLIVTSPPYFALRSYQDDGGHYDGQLGSEATPADFVNALWAVTDELWRVLRPTGSLWVNLGDKYAGSGGHNNSGLNTDKYMRGHNWDETRDAPKSYNRSSDVPAKSLMGLPWRYALGLICPGDYRGYGVAPNADGPPVNWPQWTLRAEVVWNKPNGLPESVTDRVRRSHEQWFHLTKQGRYYAAVDEVREQHVEPARSTGRIEARGTGRAVRAGANQGFGLVGDKPREYNPLGKLPGSVWTIASEPLVAPPHLGVDHFAAFPTEWPRRIVLGWSPAGICTKCGEGRVPVTEKTSSRREGGYRADNNPLMRRPDEKRETIEASTLGMVSEFAITGYSCRCDIPIAPTRPAVVLDPFAGTGTVPMVARTLGRYGIGIDLSRDYLRLAAWRVFRSGHGRKAMARTDRERQGSLW